MDMLAMIVGGHMLGNMRMRRDGYENQRETVAPSSAFSVAYFVWTLIGTVVSLCAAWLSWTCNTRMGISLAAKVVWAVLAYIFGFLYLIYYALIRSDACSALGRIEIVHRG